MNHFLAQNAIRPAVDRIYGFDEVPEAFARLRAGLHFGKIVVKL
jgi:NADPH:quinone reductase-like Zn-dependent oxidoreductase